MSELKDQLCPFCGENKAALREEEIEIPYFGRVYLFSMDCSACGTRKADVEPAEKKEPCRYTLEVASEDDLNIKVVKSGEATVKIPHIITIEPGPASEGYITNVEGLLARIREAIQTSINDEEDEEKQKKGKKLLKKLTDVTLGRESLSIIIEDPTGNSGIVSDKAERK